MEQAVHEKLVLGSGALLILLHIYITWRIFQSYRRTRVKPALLMAAAFFFAIIFFALPFEINTWLTANYDVTRDPSLLMMNRLLRSVGSMGLAGGLTLFFVFTQQVFRPHTPWAVWLVILLGAMEFLAQDLVLMLEGPENLTPWLAHFPSRELYVIATFFGFMWMAIESLATYARYHAAFQEGDALDPLVIHRLLLWGICGIIFAQSALGNMFADPDKSAVNQEAYFIIWKSISLSVYAVLSFLSWAPPRAYATWIRRRAGVNPDDF